MVNLVETMMTADSLQLAAYSPMRMRYESQRTRPRPRRRMNKSPSSARLRRLIANAGVRAPWTDSGRNQDRQRMRIAVRPEADEVDDADTGPGPTRLTRGGTDE